MKRTRQVYHYDQDMVPVDISGCRMFHGEDLRKSPTLHRQIALVPLPARSRACRPTRAIEISTVFNNLNGGLTLLFLAFNERQKYQAELQKQWVVEQTQEKQRTQQEIEEEEK